MNPRLRRLAADFEALRSEFSGHRHVHIEPLGPLPPERYRVTYRVPGLRLQGDQPMRVDEHQVEIHLPLGYPREQPHCVPLTPLFHPNVDQHYCIADYWSAGEGLADVVVKIGDMIQYRIFNTKSPLNALAAYWADQNAQLFPVGHVEFGQPELQIELRIAESAVEVVARHHDPASTQEPALEVTLRTEEEVGA